MILVDATVLVDHLRKPEVGLSNMLNANNVFMHPMVIGELACGYLKNRKQALENRRCLPTISELSHDQVISLIAAHNLVGRGIGFIDMHLLCSVLDYSGSRLWTRDKKLNPVTNEFNIAFEKNH